MPDPGTPMPVRFGGVTPIFSVKNVAASVEYYVMVLGFKIDFHEPGIMASVSRGRCGLFLVEGDQGHPGGWVWVGVSDIEALVEEFRAKGARLRHPPTNYRWAYEMQIEDLDGNVLRFGSEPKPDRPLGEWFDMRGDRWEPLEDGHWRRVE